MKTTSLAALLIIAPVATSAAIAGPLTPPPGPVAPTMKTLDEVEPRIPIGPDTTPGDATASFVIDSPGSYYLADDIIGEAGKHGIRIDGAQGVTVDLMGFTMLGIPGSLDAIHLQAQNRDNIVIRNGHIRGWDGSGISVRINTGRIEHITAAENGAWGIDNGDGNACHILECEAHQNGQTVADTGGINAGPFALITRCVSRANTGVGIRAATSSTIDGCLASNTIGDGIDAGAYAIVTGCTCTINTGDGIEAGIGCAIVENLATLNGFGAGDGAGILVVGEGCRIEGNSVGWSDRGIDIDATGSIIRGNTTHANFVGFDIVAGNSVGPIVDVSGVGDISAVAGAEHPWANHVH